MFHKYKCIFTFPALKLACAPIGKKKKEKIIKRADPL